MKYIILLISFSLSADCSSVQELTKIVSKIRNIELKHTVPCEISNKDGISKLLRRIIDKEYPDTKIKFESAIYKALGFIPQESDYKNLIINVYTNQLAGIYDPYDNKFLLPDWIPENIQHSVIIHELTHAIVDQKYELSNFLDSNKTSDELIARSSIAEGDAMTVMLEEQEVTDYLPQYSNISNISSGLSYLMQFTYNEGYLYLKNKSNINNYYEHPPLSTREILYNKKYKNIKINNDFDYEDVLGVATFKAYLANKKINLDENIIKDLEGDQIIIKNNKVIWYLKFESGCVDILNQIGSCTNGILTIN